MDADDLAIQGARASWQWITMSTHGCWWPGDTRSQGIMAVNHIVYPWMLMTWRYKEPGHHGSESQCLPMDADDLAIQGARASWQWITMSTHGCWWPGDTRSQGIMAVNHIVYPWMLMTWRYKEPGHHGSESQCLPMDADDLAIQGARASWQWITMSTHGCWWPGDTRSQGIMAVNHNVYPWMLMTWR